MFSKSGEIDITVDSDRCIRCGACEASCPSRILSWEADELRVSNPGRCIGCGHCVAVCADSALSHSELPAEKFVEIENPESLDREELKKLFIERRSCRRFLDEPVSRDQVDKLIDIARWAPTSTNSQNIRFMVFQGRDAVRELAVETSRHYLALQRQLANPIVRFGIGLKVGRKTVAAYRLRMPAIVEMFTRTLAGEDDRLFYNASSVMLLFSSGLPHLANAGCNLAAMEILLAAQSMDLGACFNGYALTALIRDRKMRERFDIPKGYTVGAVIAVGKPDGVFYRVPPRNKRRVIWRG